MPVSAGYVSREAVTNLWRNRLMTVAAILTVAVSLALVGSSLLLKQGASKATPHMPKGVHSNVWVYPAARAPQTTWPWGGATGWGGRGRRGAPAGAAARPAPPAR